MIISLGMIGYLGVRERQHGLEGNGCGPEQSRPRKSELEGFVIVPRPLFPHCASRDIPEVFCVVRRVLERREEGFSPTLYFYLSH
jgi:hypothetical protein